MIKLKEDWKLTVDEKRYAGVLSTDMSKAFDSLNPPLMINNLKECDVSTESLQLIISYFANGLNRVKLDSAVSTWKNITRGCPQG